MKHLIEASHEGEIFNAWEEDDGKFRTLRKMKQVRWEREYDTLEEMIKAIDWHWWILKGVQPCIEPQVKEYLR